MTISLMATILGLGVAIISPEEQVGSKLSGTGVVVNQASDTITLIDMQTMNAYRHVPVVGGPHEARVSPDGKSVIVTNYFKPGVGPQNTLSWIALPSGDTLKTVDISPYRMPHDVRWVDQSRVVCTSEANQSLLLVNLQTGKVEREFKTQARGSHMLTLSQDQKRLYCSNMGGGSVSAFEFETGKKLADIPTGSECEGVGVTPDGRWVWAGNRAEDTVSVIDTSTLKVVAKLESPGFPYRVQFTPNGKWALIPHAEASSLVLFNVDTKTRTREIPLGLTKVNQPSAAGVFPLPDNVHALVTVRNDNSVLLVDLATGQTIARVEVQESPDGVGYSPVQR